MLIELTLRRKNGTFIDFDNKDENGKKISRRALYHFKPLGFTAEQLRDPEVYLCHPHVCDITNKADVKTFLSIDGYEIFEQTKEEGAPESDDANVEAKSEPAQAAQAPEKKTLRLGGTKHVHLGS